MKLGNTNRRCVQRPLGVESLEFRRLLAAELTGMTDEHALVCVASDLESSSEVFLATAEGEAIETNGTDRFQSVDELEGYLIEDALKRWDAWFGQSLRGRIPFHSDIPPLLPGVPLLQFASSGEDFVLANTTFSETNVQVAGVDEADYVKTDGEYLYVLQRDELVIIDVRMEDQLDVVSRIELETNPMVQFLNGDQLTIISQDYIDGENVTSVTILNIADRGSPDLVQHMELDGSFVDARAIGDQVHVFVNNDFHLPPPQRVDENGTVVQDRSPWYSLYGPDDLWVYPHASQDYRYETKEEYLERVEDQILDLVLPRQAIFSAEGDLLSDELLSAVEEIYYPVLEDADSMVSIVSIDVTTPADPAVVSVPSKHTTAVYVSGGSIYLFQNNVQTPAVDETNTILFDWMPPQMATTVLKFEIETEMGAASSKVDYAAVGLVKGSMLNQFSADEYDGHLRIATTSGWGEAAENHLFVLQHQDDELVTVGSIDGLAPGEQIYSASFSGDRGYLVTFVRTDPLFTIDLSDPTDPKVLGELKVPGFSNYMQQIGDQHILGIGRNADELTGFFQELQISLFDVTDDEQANLIDRYLFDGGRTTWSDATYDHHAVGYFEDAGVLTVPVYSGGWELGPDTDYGPKASVFVFELDVNAGFSLLGTIDHSKNVNRSILIDDVLFTISSDTIRSNDLLDPSLAFDSLNYVEEGVATSQSIWHNLVDANDVNADGLVSPLDLLLVINDMNDRLSEPLGVTKLSVTRDDGVAKRSISVEKRTLAPESALGRPNYVDVNRDGRRNLLDALQIINRINEQSRFEQAVDDVLVGESLLN